MYGEISKVYNNPKNYMAGVIIFMQAGENTLAIKTLLSSHREGSSLIFFNQNAVVKNITSYNKKVNREIILKSIGMTFLNLLKNLQRKGTMYKCLS